MQFIGRFNQLLLGAFSNREIVAGIVINNVAVGADVGLLQGVIFVEPFSVVLTFILQPRTADFQQFAVRFGLGNAVLRVVRLDHPAKDFSIAEGVMKRVTAVLNGHAQLTGPLLSERKRGVNNILLGNADLAI